MMAVYRDISTNHTMSSDARFRDWGGSISAGLAAVGLTKTADSGQINWATATFPVSNNTDAGYEVWRFNDPDQADKPVYFALHYGRGSSSTPRFRVTLGTGSDGNGTITGATIGAGDQFTATANNAYPRGVNTPNVSGIIHIAHQDGEVAIVATMNAAAADANGNPYGAVFGRTKTPQGAPRESGALFMVYWNDFQGHTRHIAIDSDGTGATQSNAGGVGHVVATGAHSAGTSCKVVTPTTRQVGGPITSVVFFSPGDVAQGDEGPIEMYGVTRQYKVVGCSAGGNTLVPPGNERAPLAVVNQ